MLGKSFLLALCVLLGAIAVADDGGLPARANDAYQASDWATALDLYGQIVKHAPGDARAHYRLAVAARQSDDAALAGEALTQAAALGVPVPFIEIERAKLHAGNDDGEAALGAIERAVAAGFSDPQGLQEATEFRQLAADERFDALVERAAANQAPCDIREEFHQFDFWVGEWEVRDARDVVVGTNKISRAEGGCYLFEQWTDTAGGTGSSMNFYDAASGKWVQQWISQSGSQIRIEGGLQDGSMVLTGKIFYINQARQADFRGRWTPLKDGRVRQFFEQSVDGGETWGAWFEGFYSRNDTGGETPD